MLTYNFENIGSDTLYEYLYKSVKNDIMQGKIKSGEKLPSKRALAKNLAISVITVENAYGLVALSSYYHSSAEKHKYENVFVMNYSFVDCEKMDYVAKVIGNFCE